MQTTDNSLSWLLQSLIASTPAARHALVLSRDGLKLSWTEDLTVDRADQLAAICSGVQALAQGAAIGFGDGTGGVHHSMMAFEGGLVFILTAGDGAHLAVVTRPEADPGTVGTQMSEIVDQLGDHLRAEQRDGIAQ
ncbi:roadblock/LC7 domain-containing protein [Streptomyces sp. NPDC093223]|uniref:roadblock/LC7 domain-containing protein n=1 Tax=Streptomyces sp. NPDC093223 TaxID=3366033 RepID=UPI003812BDDC